ncbi:MAG: DsrE/DsrF/DrsH-like family protein [Gammaproteobacteria bacterium]
MSENNGMTIISSKGTLDWAFPPFIVGSTAAAMGKEVTIFFTFYGLGLLLKDLSGLRVSPQGNPAMPMKMPFGPQWLQKIDFGPKIPNIMWNIPGMELFATSMMKKTMKKNNIATIEELRDVCLEMGVKLIACEMTIGMFGYSREDFIDGIEYAGAATYLDIAQGSNHDLFI